jgi:hypothetical protein
MATKATVFGTPYIITKAVASGQSVAQGTLVSLASDELTLVTADSDDVVGVAYTSEDGTWPATAGDYVGVALLGSPCSVPVLVAAAGCKQGQPACAASGGIIDQGATGGTSLSVVIGTILDTGVSTDLVGVWLGSGGGITGLNA